MEDARVSPPVEERRETPCPICGGAGYVVADLPVDHPAFGRLIPCQCRAAELEARHREELLRMSQLEPFRDKTFDSFDGRLEGVQEAYRICRAYAENPDGWLLLMGPVGCGKTHLAAAIANHALSRGIATLFTVVPDLLDHLRSTFAPDSPLSYDEMFERVRNVNLLILDDLGTEAATPWAVEKLYQIFNHRYNYRMPTVVTTNRRPERLEERIYSRLMDPSVCTVVNLWETGARDYRRFLRERGGLGRRRPRRR